MPTLDLANKLNATAGPAGLNTGAPFGPRNTVDLDGGAAADSYVVNLTGATDYIVNVHDSGAVGDGADTLTINGTTTSDVFLIRANFVARLASATSTDRNAFVERINYDRTMNTLAVNGGAGADEFYADDNSAITTLDGGAGEDLFQFGQMFGAERTAPAHVAFGDEITTVHTTAGWLSRGISFSTTDRGMLPWESSRSWKRRSENSAPSRSRTRPRKEQSELPTPDSLPRCKKSADTPRQVAQPFVPPLLLGCFRRYRPPSVEAEIHPVRRSWGTN